MRNYKNLRIWKRAKSLAKDIYEITVDYPKEEKYGLVSQMRRSSVSVASNIAEGAGRSTTKDFLYFVNIAMGSLNELSTQLAISLDVKIIDSDAFSEIDERIERLKRMIYTFHKTTKTNAK